MKIFRFIKRTFHRFKSLSSRQVVYELKSNIWLVCLFYGIVGAALAAIAYFGDLHMRLGEDAARFFQADYELTRQIISSLVAGIITLNAFTLNSILVVLTNFSGQFTPRMLTTFIADRRTQHLMGVFNLAFVFILLTFFLIDEEVVEYYTLIPSMTILVMLVAIAIFIFFINHTVKWMQVPNIMHNMKNESQKQILNTLVKDLEEYRTSDPSRSIFDKLNGEGTSVCADRSGYIQIVDYKRLIQYAQSVDAVVRFERRIGEFVLKGTPLITYWNNGNQSIDEQSFRKRIFIGTKKTEVQDIEYGINKLKEIAIKSLGNDDPDTASNAIFQLTDLLLSISTVSRFTPYLTDSENELRVIIKKESFDFYLYSTFSHITIYAKKDPVITNDILEAMSLLVQSIDKKHHKSSWEFALMVAKGYNAPFTFGHNERQFYHNLAKISKTTGNQEAYEEFVDKHKQQHQE